MGGFLWLGLGAALLLVGHFALSALPVRSQLITRLGETQFAVLYSTIALAAVGLLGIGFAVSPYEILWTAPSWAFWVPLAVMPFALLLILCGAAQTNPTAILQADALGRPGVAAGIIAVTRHPVQWGLLLFALAHVPANGDVASLILFGSLALLAIFGSLHQDARNRATRGEDWARFEAQTSWLPFAGVLSRKTHLSAREIGPLGPGLALVAFLALLWLHPLLFGVSPLPF